MGIVDQSITYSSFYAIPMLLLLVFLRPYVASLLGNKTSSSTFSYAWLIMLIVILPFSGPLVPGVVLVIVALAVFYTIRKYFTDGRLTFPMSKGLIVLMLILSILSIYSIYIGQFNSEGQGGELLSIGERYKRLPMGLFYIFSQKLALPLLLVMIGVNYWLIRQFTIQPGNLIPILKWMIFFAVIYILLLPLGGTREYRPNIIRKDTFLPVILTMVFYYGYSTYYILKNSNFRYWRGYLAAIILFSLIFSYADEPDFNHDNCEREQLHKISSTSGSPVKLSTDCTVFSWSPIRDSIHTKAHGSMFEYWNITQEQKLFFQIDKQQGSLPDNED